MSKSSKTLKVHELDDLRKAQMQAASMSRLQWVQWMRATYSFALAVRMSKYLGFSTPCLSFYLRMRAEGILLRSAKASRIQSTAPCLINWGLLHDVERLN